ncbi:MAG: hypothetical protein QOG84_1066 [Sphingomonadales bacterium]|nr:hypothetical protein [Sphingomonadales bacterium]
MSAPELVAAKTQADAARARLMETVAELQQRLKPGTIAGNAWEGVKEKTGDMAGDAVEAVKARPVVVSTALGAFALFLARSPIKSAVSRLFSSDEDDGLVTTRLADGDGNYDLTAPQAERPRKKGAKK